MTKLVKIVDVNSKVEIFGFGTVMAPCQLNLTNDQIYRLVNLVGGPREMYFVSPLDSKKCVRITAKNYNKSIAELFPETVKPAAPERKDVLDGQLSMDDVVDEYEANQAENEQHTWETKVLDGTETLVEKPNDVADENATIEVAETVTDETETPGIPVEPVATALETPAQEEDVVKTEESVKNNNTHYQNNIRRDFKYNNNKK